MNTIFSKQMLHCLIFKLHATSVLLNERKCRLVVETVAQVVQGQFLVSAQTS